MLCLTPSDVGSDVCISRIGVSFAKCINVTLTYISMILACAVPQHTNCTRFVCAL